MLKRYLFGRLDRYLTTSRQSPTTGMSIPRTTSSTTGSMSALVAVAQSLFLLSVGLSLTCVRSASAIQMGRNQEASPGRGKLAGKATRFF